MLKKNILMRKKIIKGLFGIFALSPIIAGFVINNSSNESFSGISQNLQAFSNGQKISGFQVDDSYAHEGYTLLNMLNRSENGEDTSTISGIGIKIPNFSSSDEQAHKKAKEILSIYNGLPSNIVTVGNDSNIENIVWVDNSKWNTTGNSKYKIFNLGSTSTYENNSQNNPNSSDGAHVPTSFSGYNITTKSQLPAFNQKTSTDSEGNAVTENISEEFFNSNGVLALQITVSPINTSTTTAQWQSFYVLIPGFGGNLTNNALSNNPMLPSQLYTSGVDSVSDNDLNNFLVKSWQENSTSVFPNISVVSRNNDSANGILNFTSSFNFALPENIQFSSSFQGVTDSDISSLTPVTGQNVNVTTNNTYLSKVSYDMNFKISGFQPSPAVSDIQVFIIVIVIIASAVAISLLAFGVTTITKKIRFKNKM